MKDIAGKFPVLIRGVLGGGLAVLALSLGPFSCGKVSEVPVKVVEVRPADKEWVVSKEAVSREPAPFVMRVRHLRTERLPVEIMGGKGGNLVIKSPELGAQDLLVISPAALSEGGPVVPSGLNEERLILLTLEAGMAAVTAEDLKESLRFIASTYSDPWGFDRDLMRRLLKRAYKEFDEPRLEAAGPLEIRTKEGRAEVEAKVRLTALYRGRRNYLLGDEKEPNQLFLQMEKSAHGWKVASMKGVKPLGFEEDFIRLLGAEIGLALNKAEGREKKAACMPCRGRMSERFGPY